MKILLFREELDLGEGEESGSEPDLSWLPDPDEVRQRYAEQSDEGEEGNESNEEVEFEEQKMQKEKKKGMS